MRKVSLFFIVFSLLFMVKIDVLAKVDTKGTSKGASLENAKKVIGDESFQIAQNDKFCLYESPIQEGYYVIFYFEYYNDINEIGAGTSYQNKPGYVISDITPGLSTNYMSYYNPRNFQYFRVENASNVIDHSGTFKGKHWYQATSSVSYYIYTGSNVWDFCRSMMLYFDGSQLVKYIPVSDDYGDSEVAYYVETNANSQVEDFFATIENKDKLTDEEKEKQTCDINYGTQGFSSVKATLQKDDNSGWYLKAGNTKICFGKTIGYNDIVTDAKFNDDFPDTFSCDNYCYSSKVVNNDSSCSAYFVPKVNGACSTNVSSDITTGVHQAGTRLANYVSYQNVASSFVIGVFEKDDGIEVEGKGSLNSKITNISSIASRFKGDKKNQPTYLYKFEDSYEFSDENKTGATEVYINSFKLTELPSFGEEELYDTCEDLMGESFLSFLNETVFKVLYIGIPILLIVLTSFDFAKVVFSDDKEELQKAGKKFARRVIVAVLIYLVPTILIFVSNLMGADEIKECVKYFQNVKTDAESISND